ncbi:hypothetical protein F3Y22_tig00111941pilonHSYRG00091 [Hibiscus syriacus]|uniref:Uncharacterized protein n=1 Tax=Hibiscus syriacus TaxID=106335 RepID=A0A6A2XP81_HIBSY|nr:hypothetical protein F3Y22_tig00111941pilonHSYRG00091 [Hibiscus syriacus]
MMFVIDYEIEFMRLVKYAPRLASSEKEKCEWFLKGLYPLIRSVVALHHDVVLNNLVARARIVEKSEPLPTGPKFHYSDRTLKQPRSPTHTVFVNQFGKRSRDDMGSQGHPRARPVTSTAPIITARGSTEVYEVPLCSYCNKRHPGECWRKTGGCFRCGSQENRFIYYPLLATGSYGPSQSQASVKASTRSSGRSTARQSELIYATRRYEDRDESDEIEDIFLKPFYLSIGLDCLNKTANSSGNSSGGTSYIRQENAKAFSSRLHPLIQTLVQLWIARGFVKQSAPNKSLEEIGLDCFKDLAERSFFQEITENSYWGTNIRVLKLDGCLGIEELPKKIEKLVNLTHLSCFDCWSLTHMPRRIGKLTSLQTLPQFVVDRRGSHDGGDAADLSELGGLNNLRGMLWIENLGLVKNAKEEFRAANLKEEQHLESLALDWGGTTGADEEKSLEDLQPHPNLKELRVILWRGSAMIPSWLPSLTNLKDSCTEESPQLEERCRKDIGADWHKIAHIPRIEVNGRWVQRLQ